MRRPRLEPRLTEALPPRCCYVAGKKERNKDRKNENRKSGKRHLRPYDRSEGRPTARATPWPPAASRRGVDQSDCGLAQSPDRVSRPPRRGYPCKDRGCDQTCRDHPGIDRCTCRERPRPDGREIGGGTKGHTDRKAGALKCVERRRAGVAKKERLTEDLKYRTEMLRLAWATLIAVGAGTIGLVLKDIDLRVAAGAGAVVMIVLGVVVGHLHRSIRVRIESLEEI